MSKHVPSLKLVVDNSGGAVRRSVKVDGRHLSIRRGLDTGHRVRSRDALVARPLADGERGSIDHRGKPFGRESLRLHVFSELHVSLVPKPGTVRKRKMDPTWGLTACTHAVHVPGMANRLKELRKARGLSQERLAQLVGTSRSQIVKLEREERRLARDWLERLAAVLDCHPGEIISEMDLTAEEAEAVAAIRALPPHQRRAWLDMAAAMAAPPAPERPQARRRRASGD